MSSSKGYIHIPIKRRAINSSVVSAVRKRQGSSLPLTLENDVNSYVAQFKLGTPGQTVEALVDTGSSDLWVYSSAAVRDHGFDTSKSSTYKLLQEDGFSISYVSGSAEGDWVSDNLEIGNSTIKAQQFAVVKDKSADQDTTTGILGIARVTGESVSSRDQVYLNVPAQLKQQGVIQVNAYSLFLDNISATSGSILFGGIDKARYTGTLAVLPFTDKERLSVEFTVAGQTLSGVLDSGTSLTYLPQNVFDAVVQEGGYDISYNDQAQVYVANSDPSSAKALQYTFGNVTISVPASELFIKQQDGTYIFSILTTAQSENITLVGDSTLRSAYVVYDLDNNKLGIAQPNYNSGSPEIVPLTSAGIPSS